jgi:hypothetical protein
VSFSYVGDEGDSGEGVALPGLHRLRGVRHEARRGQPDPVRRVRPLVPHLLHDAAPRSGSPGNLEV